MEANIFTWRCTDSYWRQDGTCSHCGSIRPSRALELIKAGATVVPTDKNYKVYIESPEAVGARGKCYLNHFSEAQAVELVVLYETGKMKLAVPGYFYSSLMFHDYKAAISAAVNAIPTAERLGPVGRATRAAEAQVAIEPYHVTLKCKDKTLFRCSVPKLPETAAEVVDILRKAIAAIGSPELAADLDQPATELNFGEAIAALKAGHKVSRLGWNGMGMWLALQVPDAGSKMTLPYIYMSTAQGGLVPWLASQSDMLAEDWTIVS